MRIVSLRRDVQIQRLIRAHVAKYDGPPVAQSDDVI